jgi:hypothetical protein
MAWRAPVFSVVALRQTSSLQTVFRVENMLSGSLGSLTVRQIGRVIYIILVGSPGVSAVPETILMSDSISMLIIELHRNAMQPKILLTPKLITISADLCFKFIPTS